MRHTKRIRINKKIRSWYIDLWLRRIPLSFGARGRVLSKPGIIHVARRRNTIDRLLIMGHIQPKTHGLGPGPLCPRPSRQLAKQTQPSYVQHSTSPDKALNHCVSDICIRNLEYLSPVSLFNLVFLFYWSLDSVNTLF